MSTNERLEELVGGKVLVDWSSTLLPVSAHRRRFLASANVAAELDRDPWRKDYVETAGSAAERRIRTHALINQFIEGQSLTVGVHPSDCDLKCLAPMMRVVTWRIWEIRPWRRARLTRVLGLFASQDVFVALKLVPRRWPVPINWDRLSGEVDAKWISLFGTNLPLEWEGRPPTYLDVGSNFGHVD
jgi:hypothetical protein